ncbi:MAG: dTDP-4-dehydrorhamnose reductase [Candidatus Hydrogenedentes bacterium]|nr:dTDP-4-dehydrorhamnose reductase [Candidatus Hydrogenedentota bacterium]
MHTLIVGARGQLGRDLVDVFSREGNITGLDIPELDITDADALRAATQRFRPTLVVNAAAYTDVEGAEDHRAAAFAANEEGARNVARLAAQLGVPTVYFSTDFVFGGSKSTPYAEDDPVAPRGVYAESKAAGEAAVREACAQHFIVRTAWLYGAGGNNFVEKILRAAAARPRLRVVNDETGSPTYTRDLAEATCALCKTTAYGTYHAVNAGACSRFDFARAILRGAGVKTPVDPCTASEYPSKAPRPVYSVLSTEKLRAACGYTMPPWEDALRRYLQARETQ